MKDKINFYKFLSLNLLYYAIFSFIAWDFNPTHWKISNNFVGGVFITIFEIILLGSSAYENTNEENNED